MSRMCFHRGRMLLRFVYVPVQSASHFPGTKIAVPESTFTSDRYGRHHGIEQRCGMVSALETGEQSDMVEVDASAVAPGGRAGRSR